MSMEIPDLRLDRPPDGARTGNWPRAGCLAARAWAGADFDDRRKDARDVIDALQQPRVEVTLAETGLERLVDRLHTADG